MNASIPFFYRLITQESGSIHINVSDINTIKNSSVNTQWSVVTISRNNNTADYVTFTSPEELVADINNSVSITMNSYK